MASLKERLVFQPSMFWETVLFSCLVIRHYQGLIGLDCLLTWVVTLLSGWWFRPIWKICSSNWLISPIFGVNMKNIFELPPTCWWNSAPGWHPRQLTDPLPVHPSRSQATIRPLKSPLEISRYTFRGRWWRFGGDGSIPLRMSPLEISKWDVYIYNYIYIFIP